MVNRILCLGNNTDITDTQTRSIAKDRDSHCWGLLTDLDSTECDTSRSGLYHSSVYDLSIGKLRELAVQFGHIIILPQTIAQYTDPEAFYRTVKFAQSLETTLTVEWIDPSIKQHNKFWETLVEENPSFCIFPFIELLVQNGHTTVCCRSLKPVTTLSELTNYSNDPNYGKIRQSMLRGDLLPDHCGYCYNLERQGIISNRQQETLDWTNRLGLRTLEDLDKFDVPVYYEVRPGNICNLQCRMCRPECSHKIATEYRRLGLYDAPTPEFTGFDFVDVARAEKIYISGGEPTAMPEFYNFVDKCIQAGKTDLEIITNTNGTKLSKKFKRQLKHFDNFQFIVSVDGIGPVNHYIRWPSCWEDIVVNVDYLISQKHYLTFNTTVSIYNVGHLAQWLHYIDLKWPNTGLHLQHAVSSHDCLSAYNHPDRQFVLSSLEHARESLCYANDSIISNFIDNLHKHYSMHYGVDKEKLDKFYSFNDALDQSRSVALKDFLPELDKGRGMI